MSREAMKLALKGLERSESELHKARATLKQALEQPEPETVECHTCKGLGRIYMGCGSWIHCDTCNTTGKATTPPKREWVGLTDEERAAVFGEFGLQLLPVRKVIAEEIEAKLKEKNT